MKTLIMVVGESKTLPKFLGTLCGAGKYAGDILIFNYDLPEEVAMSYDESDNITVVSQIPTLSTRIQFDRHFAALQTLNHAFGKMYDVVALMHSDMVFTNPIQPLFDMAKDKIIYTTENKQVEAVTLNCITANDLKNTGHPESYRAIWDSMLKKPAINNGLYLGPVNLMAQLESFIINNTQYGLSDQLWLNTALYGALDISAEAAQEKVWNYNARLGYKQKDGKVFDYTGQIELSIIHFMGRHAKVKQEEWR